MININVTDIDGSERTISGDNGVSLMVAIRDNGFDSLLALCGGCCSCATCHVIIASEWSDKLTPMSSDENDLLDSSDYRVSNSRLSCQILLEPQLDNMRVTIVSSS